MRRDAAVLGDAWLTGSQRVDLLGSEGDEAVLGEVEEPDRLGARRREERGALLRGRRRRTRRGRLGCGSGSCLAARLPMDDGAAAGGVDDARLDRGRGARRIR